MLPEDWPAWLVVITGLGLVSTALLAITALLVRTGRGMRTIGGWIGGIVRKEVGEIVDARLAPIAAEFKTNGGSSLRDRVEHVANQQERTARTLDDHMRASSLDRTDLRHWLERLDPGRLTHRPDHEGPSEEDGPGY